MRLPKNDIYFKQRERERVCSFQTADSLKENENAML